MTSQQHVISREALTLESMSVLSHFPRAGLAQRRLGFTNKALFNAEKAAFESLLSIEMHFWHHEHGVVGLQLCICCIVFCSLDFSVHVYKWEGFFPPMKWDLCASYLLQKCQWAGKKCLWLLDLMWWPTLNDVEITKCDECDWVSSNGEKYMLLKTLLFVSWTEVEMSASENRRINGPKSSKVL